MLEMVFCALVVGSKKTIDLNEQHGRFTTPLIDKRLRYFQSKHETVLTSTVHPHDIVCLSGLSLCSAVLKEQSATVGSSDLRKISFRSVFYSLS